MVIHAYRNAIPSWNNASSVFLKHSRGFVFQVANLSQRKGGGVCVEGMGKAKSKKRGERGRSEQMSYCALCQTPIETKYVFPFTMYGDRQCDLHTYHPDCWMNVLKATNWCILCTPITKVGINTKTPKCFVCHRKFDNKSGFVNHFHANHRIGQCKICRIGVVKDMSQNHESHCLDNDSYIKCPAVGCNTRIKASIVATVPFDGSATKIDEHHTCRKMYRCANCNVPFVEPAQLDKHSKWCIEFGPFNKRIPRKASIVCNAAIEFVVSGGTLKTTYEEYTCPLDCPSLINQYLYAQWKAKDPLIFEALAEHHACPMLSFCRKCGAIISPSQCKSHNCIEYLF